MSDERACDSCHQECGPEAYCGMCYAAALREKDAEIERLRENIEGLGLQFDAIVAWLPDHLNDLGIIYEDADEFLAAVKRRLGKGGEAK